MGRLIAALALAAALAAAGAGAGAAAQTGERVPYWTLDRGQAGDYSARSTLVIRDRRRYRQVWNRLQSSIPAPRRPRVDFRRHMLIAVLRGMGTGTGIQIESVTRAAGGLRVRAIETRAGEGCVVPQWVVNPYELVRVARRAGPVATDRVERIDDPC